MNKKLLVISSSQRHGSNSDLLADAFLKGAADAGLATEKISLAGKQIAFCKGCLACQKTQQCIIDDDARVIAAAMKDADIIAFASPVYYSICGQLKTLLDRANSLYPSDYAFRDIYALLAAADTEASAQNGAVTAIQGWVDCFEKASLKGVIFAAGAGAPNEALHHPALQEAYAAGRQAALA